MMGKLAASLYISREKGHLKTARSLLTSLMELRLEQGASHSCVDVRSIMGKMMASTCMIRERERLKTAKHLRIRIGGCVLGKEPIP
jgi:hypothetical protein